MHKTSNKIAFALDCFSQCTVPRKQYNTLKKGNTLNLQRGLLFVFEIIHNKQMLQEQTSSIIDSMIGGTLQDRNKQHWETSGQEWGRKVQNKCSWTTLMWVEITHIITHHCHSPVQGEAANQVFRAGRSLCLHEIIQTWWLTQKYYIQSTLNTPSIQTKVHYYHCRCKANVFFTPIFRWIT